MVVLPPGTLLQLMYLRERLKQLPAGRFIEIGPGSGEITRLLLELGWTGSAYDLEAKTIEALNERFSQYIANGRLSGINDNFITSPSPYDKVDLVISCMVMEHMDDNEQMLFINKTAHLIKGSGLMIGFVPASPRHWGIEDDIAGHFRRYTKETLESLFAECHWSIIHRAGLTYPVSNILLPLSNFLVNRAEKAKLKLSEIEKTKLSGRRKVNFKTHFPALLILILNKFTLLPFFYLQKLFSSSRKALVLYFEARMINTSTD